MTITYKSSLPIFLPAFTLLFIFVSCVSPVFGQAAGIRIADASTVEGNTGAHIVEASVFLSPPASSPVNVSYTTRDGSASGADYRPASGTVSFARGESVKKIGIAVVGETAIEGNEKFEVVLSNSSGPPITRATASVTIVNDDFAAGRVPSTYEVRFTFSGHSGSLASAPDCPVNRSGKIVMSGLLTGDERVGQADDIIYTGELQFDADVDMCESTGEGSNAKLCSISTKGSGLMKVELTVNYDNRGAYIKASKVTGFESTVFGGCDSLQVNEERGMYPDKSMAMIFNGFELPMDTTKLRVGTYSVSIDPGQVTAEVLRQIR